MTVKRFGIALALLLGATSAGWSQSATGSNYGVPPSGTAFSRSGGGGHAYVRHHDSGDSGQSSSAGGERDARSVDGGGGSSRGERDARDAEGSSPVARQASTPSH